jgi:hypothetical protein
VFRGRVTGNQQALIAIDIMDGEGQPRSLEVDLSP